MEMCCACKDRIVGDTSWNWPESHTTLNDDGTCVDNMLVVDLYDDSCADYYGNEDWCGLYDNTEMTHFSQFSAFADCCACQALTGDALADQI